MTTTKPHYLHIAGRPVQVQPEETPWERARKRPWTKGPAYWTPERIAELKARNEVIRQLRGKA